MAVKKIVYRRSGSHQHEWHRRERKAFNGTIIGFVCKCGSVDYADLIPFKSSVKK